jgi:hypothetical protein
VRDAELDPISVLAREVGKLGLPPFMSIVNLDTFEFYEITKKNAGSYHIEIILSDGFKSTTYFLMVRVFSNDFDTSCLTNLGPPLLEPLNLLFPSG